MPDATRILFGHELRHSLRTWLWWVLPIGLMVTLTCALQPALAKGVLAAKMDAMPDALRRAFGFANVDFKRPAAYLATNFTTITLSTALFAGLLGAAMIAKEETLRTAEILYAQPTSRTRILVGKAAALAVYALAFPIALALLSIVTLSAVAEQTVEIGVIVELFIGATAIAVCFAGIGMLVAALVRDKRSASGATLGAVLGSYFVGVLSALDEVVQPLRWLSPYKLAEPAQILVNGTDVARLGLLVIAGIGAATIAIAMYKRQDIHA
ncbi:MAG TPA: ABC transporter permease subunit [Kofleriaceae bacterium]